MLLLLYITLDGCGWSSSLASPARIFSRELDNTSTDSTDSTESTTSDSGGGNGYC